MRRLGLGLALLLSFVSPVMAQTPDTLAKAAYIIDVTSGAVLMDKNSAQKIPTASMSKTMTMAIVFQAIKDGQLRLTDTLPVSEKAWRMDGSKMFVELNKQVPVEDLIKGVIVQSGNDATIVLAEGIAGSEEKFAGLMNEKAASYGLTGSHFTNASGMPDPEHYSTPRDLAILTWHLINDYPEEYKYYSIPEYTYHEITQQNRNPLLGKVAGADGVKTGHTEEAGYGLIGSAARGGRRVVMVLSGMSSMSERESEGIRLINWALDSFKVQKIVSAGQVMTEAPVVYGKVNKLALLAERDASATVPAASAGKDVTVKVKYMSPLVAPIHKGDKLGAIEGTGPGLVPQSFWLVASVDVEKKGFFGLTFDKMIQAAKNK